VGRSRVRLDLQRNLDERKVDVIPWDKFKIWRLCRIRPFNNY
jgi:hypothetical protein